MKLGQTDIEIGRFGWGSWRLDHDHIERLQDILAVLSERAVRIIDTAAIYGYGSAFGAGHAEAMLGRALRRQPSLREQFVIVSKGGLDLPTPYDSSRDALISGCEASLQRLGVDAIDIYMIHRPDLLTHAEEVAGALNTLLAAGKIKHAGVSNYQPSQVAALVPFLDSPLACHQVECSAWHIEPFENGVLDQCQQLGMTPMAWSPLAGGLLAGQAQDDPTTPAALGSLRDTMQAIGEAYNCDLASVALAFLLRVPGLVPVIGSQNPKRLAQSLDAQAVSLTRRDWYRILETRLGKPMP